jgi:hypothetical protein
MTETVERRAVPARRSAGLRSVPPNRSACTTNPRRCTTSARGEIVLVRSSAIESTAGCIAYRPPRKIIGVPRFTMRCDRSLLKDSPSRAADSGLAVPVLSIGLEMRNVR